MFPHPTVWIAGDFGEADFDPAVTWLREAAHCDVITSSSQLPPREAAPTAIVVFQARPGSITERDVERLHNLAPLARLTVVAGPWCEGELRSGRPAQGVARILWHQWKLRLPRELGILPQGPSAAASRARTLTPVDRLLQSLALPVGRQRRHGRAAIYAARRDRFESLADLCSTAGFQALLQAAGLPPAKNAAICLLDGWASLPADCCQNRSESPLILLLDWPRPCDIDRAEQHGIRHVLGQPLLVTDFLATIDQLLPDKAESAVVHPAA